MTRGAGIILLGGSSKRFSGRNKANIKIGGTSCLSRVYTAMNAAFSIVKISGETAVEDPHFKHMPRLHDWPESRSGDSPLFGVLGALRWADMAGLDYIVTMPTDLPFLTADALQNLVEGHHDNRSNLPVCFTGRNGPHGLSALWPVSVLPEISRRAVKLGELRISQLHKDLGTVTLEIPESAVDPFFNMNRPEDEIQANDIAAKLGL